ncbi:restriction endonuclease [Variovorax sp. J22R24]|uniref:restriction endonuclease n=1 Tax=Variovorax gracilis TaxID=3053502 RepID=UPI002574BB0D|nr:restriction endonuclease [Variovorax sp. J22R24]MDM0106523.1 restriction endonuclease [Variovorax sp. J22R24]
MARRKKSSPAEDLIDLVARLPWYVGVVLAVVGYVLLHRIAAAPLVAFKPGDLSGAMVGGVGRGLASVGQYILPLICLAGAAASAWRRRMRRSLVTSATRSDAPSVLDGMSWREFEMLVGEGFRVQGYAVEENDTPGPDGGVDLVLRKSGERYLVQCKQWRAFKVGVPVVRELYGAMAAMGAAGGFVVTSGQFTAEAQEFASGRNVRLIDGAKLHQLLKQAKAATSAAQTKPDREAGRSSGSGTGSANVSAPSCPRCAQAMVRRTAKKGANAGQQFWGCSDYPRCRGTA